MSEKPRILRTATVARSRLFRVERVSLRFSNGREVEFERLVGGGRGSVLVVPLLDDATLLLVREYAVGTERYELGFPKGLCEPGEDSLQAANRELMEEIGYGAHSLEHLTRLAVAPAYLAFRTDIVLARDLYSEQRTGDEPEALEVVPWPLGACGELLERGDFTEARSVAALFMVNERMKHEG